MLRFGNKFFYAVSLSVAFILGIYCCSLFSGCGQQGAPVPGTLLIKPETIQKQAAAVEAGYQVRIDSLGTAAKNLQLALQTTRTALNKVKQKNLVLQTQIYDLLDRTAAVSPDTASRIVACDSLQGKLKDLVINDILKNTLYQEVTTNLNDHFTHKDL